MTSLTLSVLICSLAFSFVLPLLSREINKNRFDGNGKRDKL
jgi:hypothetical protein